MLTTIHKGFEPDHSLGYSEINEKIREFAKFVAEKLPDHISSFVLIVDRNGFVTTAIPNGPREDGDGDD